MTYFGKIQISGQAVSDDFFAITDVKTDGLLFYEEIQKPHANLFVQRWNSQPDLLAACEEGEKRMKFLLDKILAAESYPEKIILELIEIDKTFNCMSLAKQAIDKAKCQRSRLSAGEN